MNFQQLLSKATIIAFDLDGTIVDTPYWITKFANIAREELGFSRRTEKEILGLVGKPPEVFWSDIPGLRKSESQELTSVFRRKMDEHPFDQNSLYAKVEDLLSILRERNFVLAIATNKPSANARILLEKCLVEQHFSAVLGGDLYTPKPDPAMLNQLSIVFQVPKSKIMMIGDRVDDMQCAKGAGAYAVGLLQSVESREALIESGADFVCEKIADLYDLVLQSDLNE